MPKNNSRARREQRHQDALTRQARYDKLSDMDKLINTVAGSKQHLKLRRRMGLDVKAA